jgi:YHS domain-containing protein
MKSASSIALVAVLGVGLALAASGNVEKREYVCMMQDMVLQKPGIPIQHEGKTYYGCCEMCKARIKGAPEQYTRSVDVVTGKKIDKATAFIYNLNGEAFYFATEANRKAFGENPAKYLRK